MELIAIWAVIFSAVLHAIWNFFLKKAAEPNLFVGLSKVIEALIFAPVFIYLYQFSPFGLEQLIMVTVAALLVFLYYYFLSMTYQYLEMSLAYPVSRASTLFLPALVWIFLGEGVDIIGALALVLILLGVALLSTVKGHGGEGDAAKKKIGLLLALLVAFIAALQTLWAKVVLNQLHPFLFFYSYTFIVALGYFGFTLKQYRVKQIKGYLLLQWRPISAVAVLNTASYMLFLFALNRGNTAYVGSLRQLSLVVALLLGVWLLKEVLGVRKLLGTAIVIAGSILITFAN